LCGRLQKAKGVTFNMVTSAAEDDAGEKEMLNEAKANTARVKKRTLFFIKPSYYLLE